ncbi:Dehydrodolichyl diphosphate synthase 6 [Dichanthelium oligosanthes]|uniref:Dehydrodolichyl diphosphate synthase 6 n=1 Tax=Dichanthelium oligosanthes TaxID=888268 RepID=A0A1E5WGJ2_9POAL|nr:Dehydrodolichyl diphosphate synthase 6 [Dichanthelium oligosanthes]
MLPAAAAPRVRRRDDVRVPNPFTHRQSATCVPSTLSTTSPASNPPRDPESPTSNRGWASWVSPQGCVAHHVLDEIAASFGIIGHLAPCHCNGRVPCVLFTFSGKFYNCRYGPKIEKLNEVVTTGVLKNLENFLLKCLVAVLSYGPMPKHVAFIMDGNRRYAKFRSIQQGTGHRVGFSALISNLVRCNDMGVKYVTVYAFSIDNFKRDPSEVQFLMELMEEKINELLNNQSVIYKMNCKINFWGNLDLLCEPVRLAAQQVMASTAGNTGLVFSVCMPYNSTSEIVNAVNEVCAERREVLQRDHAGRCNGQAANNGMHSEISVADLDCHMYSAGCPEPDIVIRTSGETRLSNFLLWQTTYSHLQNPDTLWPEFSFRHLIWAILQYQRVYPYLVQSRKLAKKQL